MRGMNRCTTSVVGVSAILCAGTAFGVALGTSPATQQSSANEGAFHTVQVISNDLPTPGAPIGASDECEFDGGVSNLVMGMIDGGVTGWGQRFHHSCATAIDAILATFGAPGSSGGVAPGEPVGYAIMTDGVDGPDQLIWSGTATLDADAIETNQFQSLPVDPPQAVPSSYYLVVWVEHPANTLPGPLDSNAAAAADDDVWLLGQPQGTFETFDPTSAELNTALPASHGVWLLRASGFICHGDVNADGEVNVDDLLIVLNNWGTCPGGATGCLGDHNNEGIVNVDDLLYVLNNLGRMLRLIHA